MTLQDRIRWALDNALLAQDPWELARVCEHVREIRPANVLEIGSRGGGWVMVVAGSCDEGTRFMGVDRDLDPGVRNYRQGVYEFLKNEKRSVSWLELDSTLPRTIREVADHMPVVDVLHIDGNHAYEGVSADWAAYGPLVRPGGMVVFHDILHRVDRGVRRFWHELHDSFYAANRRWDAREYIVPDLARPQDYSNATKGVGILFV